MSPPSLGFSLTGKRKIFQKFYFFSFSIHSGTGSPRAQLLSSSPPLPESQPPPPHARGSSTLPAATAGRYGNGAREGYGVQGTKELLSKKAGSREGIFFLFFYFLYLLFVNS